jgi:hypothetical protein
MFGGGGFFGGQQRIEPLKMRAVVQLKDLYSGKEFPVSTHQYFFYSSKIYNNQVHCVESSSLSFLW